MPVSAHASPGLRTWLAASLVCVGLIGCAAMSQQSPSPIPSGSPGGFSGNASAVPPSPLPGGLANQAVDSEGAKEFAAAAIRLLKDRTQDQTMALQRIRSAQSQVVAGLKYHLELDVTTQQGPRTIKVVVYRDLQNEYSLSDVAGL